MTGVSRSSGAAESDASDQTLVMRVRAGDHSAYATLWRRHAHAAYAVARSFSTLDADDLVSEAFTKVLQALRAGRGPSQSFRPYLTMTVRNIGRSLYVRESVVLDADLEARASEATSGEMLAIREFEHGVTLSAFETLPLRWQEVLWYSEVDGLPVRTISRYLGIPANAVSALLLRAKRAFRDAWVSEHLAAARSPECAPTIRDLGAYVRARLSRRATLAVQRHLAQCPSCTACLAEARRVATVISTRPPSPPPVPVELLEAGAPACGREDGGSS